LLQFPNIYFFANMGWNPEHGSMADSAVLRELAPKFFPEIAGDLTDGWHQLARQDPAACRAAADRLDRRAESGELGRVGIVGQYLFPDGLFLLKDLATSLRMRAGAVDAIKLLGENQKSTFDIVEAIHEYVKQALILQKRSGYHIALMRDGTDWLANRPWFIDGPDYEAIRKSWKSYASAPSSEVPPAIAGLTTKLRQSEFDPKIYGRMIDFLLKRSVQD
jgi:hypothetical protein